MNNLFNEIVYWIYGSCYQVEDSGWALSTTYRSLWKLTTVSVQLVCTVKSSTELWIHLVANTNRIILLTLVVSIVATLRNCRCSVSLHIGRKTCNWSITLLTIWIYYVYIRTQVCVCVLSCSAGSSSTQNWIYDFSRVFVCNRDDLLCILNTFWIQCLTTLLDLVKMCIRDRFSKVIGWNENKRYEK